MLTKIQVKLLQLLPLGEWVDYRSLQRQYGMQEARIYTVGKLMKERKLEAAIIERPKVITDADVENGFISCKIERYNGSEEMTALRSMLGYPDFIKKIDETLETEAENMVLILADRVKVLEKQLASLKKE